MKPVTLGEVADVTVGFVGSMAAEYRADGVPFLRSLNVRPFAIDFGDLKFVERGFHERIRKSALSPGDVVMVRTGKPGQAAVIPDSLPESNCSDLVVIRPGAELDSQWLMYYLNGMAGSAISSQLVGAVQQHFNVGSATVMKFLLPAMRVQQAIVSVLGALDDKIAANRQVSTVADSLLTAVAKRVMDGRDKIGLGDLIELNYGKSLPAKMRNGGDVPVVGSGGESGRHDVALTEGPAVVVGRKGSVGTVYRFDRPVFPIDTAYYVTPRNIPLSFAFYLLKAIDFSSMNTDSAMPGLNRDRAYRIEVPNVPSEDLEQFDGTAKPIFDRMDFATRESEVLARTRDELLPLLMDGRITVKQAEKRVEELV